MKKVTRTMSMLCVAAVVAAVSVPAWGYGITGTMDSTSFTNGLQGWPSYGTWSYEGGAVGHPLYDNFGVETISGFSSTTFTSDGSVVTSDSGATDLYPVQSGFYRPFGSNVYKPTGSAGFTYEWKMKVNDIGVYTSGNGWSWAFSADQAESVAVRFRSGYYYNVANGPDYMKDTVVSYNGGSVNLPGHIDAWHTYRIAVLGEAPGTGIIKANFYMDGNLLVSGFNAGTVGDPGSDSYLWMGYAGYGDLWKLNAQVDYVRIDTTGAYAPVPEPISLSLFALAGAALLRRKRA